MSPVEVTATVGAAASIAVVTTVIQNIVLTLSALGTLAIAWAGLSAWRRQLKGTSEYALAKSVLKAVYRVRVAFMRARNPAIFQYEYPEEMRDRFGHLKKEHDYEGTKAVYDARWKPLADAFHELDELNLDAEVEWGDDFRDVIVPLRKCVIEWQIAVSDLLERKQHPDAGAQTARDERADQRSILYDLGEGSEHDRFTPRINDAVAEFETRLRPHIKR